MLLAVISMKDSLDGRKIENRGFKKKEKKSLRRKSDSAPLDQILEKPLQQPILRNPGGLLRTSRIF